MTELKDFDINAIRERVKREQTIPGICERYMNDVEAYFKSYIPGLAEHEYKEMAAYCANRFTVAMSDVIAARDEEWKDSNRRYMREFEKKYKRTKEDAYE